MENSSQVISDTEGLIEAMKLEIDLTGIAIPSPFVEFIENGKSHTSILPTITRGSPKLIATGLQVVEMNNSIDAAILKLEEFRKILIAEFDQKIEGCDHLEKHKK